MCMTPVLAGIAGTTTSLPTSGSISGNRGSPRSSGVSNGEWWRSAVKLRVLRALAVLICTIATAAAGAGSAKFPGGKPLKSPNGEFEVYSKPPSSAGESHLLLLKIRGHGAQPRQLIEFGRHVTVYWAPDSKHLAVTDYAESDEATCIVIDSATGERKDVSEAAAASRRLGASKGDQHRYLECDGWKTPG